MVGDYCHCQTHVLDEAAIHHPEAWWWVKADGCDLVSGLAESVKGVWHGDVDLNDGDMKKQFDSYQSRLLEVKRLVVSSTSGRVGLCTQLASHEYRIKKDLEFLHTGDHMQLH